MKYHFTVYAFKTKRLHEVKVMELFQEVKGEANQLIGHKWSGAGGSSASRSKTENIDELMVRLEKLNGWKRAHLRGPHCEGESPTCPVCQSLIKRFKL